jgi:hypothetical protein
MEVISELTSSGEALNRIEFALWSLTSSSTLHIGKILFRATLLSSSSCSGNIMVFSLSSEKQ